MQFFFESRTSVIISNRIVISLYRVYIISLDITMYIVNPIMINSI